MRPTVGLEAAGKRQILHYQESITGRQCTDSAIRTCLYIKRKPNCYQSVKNGVPVFKLVKRHEWRIGGVDV
jgi:hypothetical protein